MVDLINLPRSPITKSKNTKIFDYVWASDIISLYKKQEKIDVSEYFDSQKVYILECCDTGYRFYYPFSLVGDEKFYKGLRSSDYDRENSSDLIFAKSQIEQNSKVLEVGCGSGKFLESILGITSNVCGLELNSLMAEKAKAKGFDVRVEKIEDFAKVNSKCFNVVCAFQVLEHIVEIDSFIKSALKLLKADGKLIFSVPNNEPFFQRFSKYEVLNLPPHHMGLWNLEVFKELAKHFDLRIEKYKLTGKVRFRADVYLRAKFLANVNSLPKQHSFKDVLKMIAFAPSALISSSVEFLRGNYGFGHISIIMRRK